MATHTITSSINIDDIAAGAWSNLDTLTINNGAIVTVNTNQTKAWKSITVNNGKLLIDNQSTTNINNFLIARSGSSTPTTILIYGLGSLEITGNWVEIGVGTGLANQELTYPSANRANAIWVETGNGTNEWDIWLNGYGCNRDEVWEYIDESFETVIGSGKYGRFFKQESIAEPYTITDPVSAQNSPTLKFGDGVHGNVIPVGARVRVPNIVITDSTPVNRQFSGTSNYSLARVDASYTGVITADKCNFDFLELSCPQASKLHLSNCAFWKLPVVQECSDFVMNSIGVGVPSVRRIYQQTAGYWYNFDFRNSFAEFYYIDGASISNFRAAVINQANGPNARDFITIGYSNNVTLNNISLYTLRPYNNSATLSIYYSNNITITGLDVSWCWPEITNSSNVTINGITFMNSLNPKLNNYLYDTSSRFCIDPNTMEEFQVGTTYYFKALSHRDPYGLGPTVESWVFAATPYVSSDIGSLVYFGAFPTGPTTATVYASLNYPAYANPAFEIYKGTEPGFVRDAGSRVYSTNTTAALNYSVTGLTAGTTYYFVLRKYTAAGVYTDSPEQIVITPASATRKIKNMCIGMEDFSLSAWVKTGVTVTVNNFPLANAPQIGTTYADKLAATLADSYVSQNITVVSGSTYSFSIYLRSDIKDTSVNISLTSGANVSTTSCVFGQKWKLFTATCVAASTTMAIKIGGSSSFSTGESLYAGMAQFNIGTKPFPYTTSATDVDDISQLAMVASWQNNGSFSGIQLNIGSAPTGQLLLTVHVGTTPNFTPTPENQLAIRSGAPLPFNITNSSYIDISNIAVNGLHGLCSTGTAAGNRSVFTSVTSNNITIRDSNLDFRYSAQYILDAVSGSKAITLRNLNLSRIRGYEQVLINSDNTCSGLTIQNVITDFPMSPLILAFSDSVVKGMSVGFTNDSVLGSSSRDAIAKSSNYTNVYDASFYEAYDSATEGRLELRFATSTKAQITGNLKFDNQGRLYFIDAGSEIIYTWPHKIMGVTSFRNIDPKVNQTLLGISTTSSHLSVVLPFYQIDNGEWKSLTSTNLFSETLSPSGFNFKIKLAAPYKGILFDNASDTVLPGDTLIGTSSGATIIVQEAFYQSATVGLITASSVLGVPVDNEWFRKEGSNRIYANGSIMPNSSSYIDGLCIYTNIDTTIKYPVIVANINVDNLVTGSAVKIYKISDGTILYYGQETDGKISFGTDYIGAIGIEARKASSSPTYQPWVTRATTSIGSEINITATQLSDE